MTTSKTWNSIHIVTVTIAIATVIAMGPIFALAQNPEAMDKLMAIKSAMDANKAKLATYTYQQVETIAIKGDVKDTKIFNVSTVNGQQQKNLISDQKAQQSGREGRLKEHIIQNQTQDYEQYGQQIAALAKQYTSDDSSKLIQAKQQGNLSLQPGSGTVNLVIKSFVKPNDQVTFTISEQTHAPVSVHINSYLDDPSDAVNISVTYAQLPDGTNHPATITVNGVKKQLTVTEQNSNYVKMPAM